MFAFLALRPIRRKNITELEIGTQLVETPDGYDVAIPRDLTKTKKTLEFPVPDALALRIVDQELWEAAKARQAAVKFEIGRDEGGQALNRAHRRKFLLSGLLTCGCCGGGYTIVATDRYGCATRRGKGTCTNTSTIMRQHLEARILSGLKDRMLAPDLVAEFVRAFAQEAAAIRAEAAGTQIRIKDDLADVQRRLEGVLRAVENGAWNTSLQTRLTELEDRQAALQSQLARGTKADTPVVLHPNAAEIYKRKVAELEVSLSDPAISLEAGEALASLIERIVLVPADDQPDGLVIELHGDLAAILSAAGAGKTPNTEHPPPGAGRGARTGGDCGLLSVVAGA
jgi:hypothetical protein